MAQHGAAALKPAANCEGCWPSTFEIALSFADDCSSSAAMAHKEKKRKITSDAELQNFYKRGIGPNRLARVSGLRDLLQLVESSGHSPELQKKALHILCLAVADQDGNLQNQSVAGEVSAVRILLKLAESSGGNPDVQKSALDALCCVVTDHPANQSTAGEESAMRVLLKLAESSDGNP